MSKKRDIRLIKIYYKNFIVDLKSSFRNFKKKLISFYKNNKEKIRFTYSVIGALAIYPIGLFLLKSFDFNFLAFDITTSISAMITLFGFTISLLAIIFSIFQLYKDNKPALPIIFSATRFFNYLGFGIGSIAGILILSSVYHSFEENTQNGIVFLSNISIIIITLLVAYSIFKIYNILTTEELFERIKKEIQVWAGEVTDTERNRENEIQKKYILDKYIQSIYEADTTLKKELTLFFVDIMLKNMNSFLTIDLSRVIYKVFNTAIKQSNNELIKRCFFSAMSFIHIGIGKKNINIIERFVSLPSLFIIELQGQNKNSLNDNVNFLIEQFIINTNFVINSKYQYLNKPEELQQNNMYHQYIFYIFNELLLYSLQNENIILFELVIDKLKRSFRHDSRSIKEYSINYEIRPLVANYRENQAKIQELLNLKYEQEYFINSSNIIKLGLFSWSVKLFLNDKLSIGFFNKIAPKLNINFEGFEEELFLMSYISNIDSSNDKFGWYKFSTPEIDEEASSVGILVSWSETAKSWMPVGYFIRLIKENIINDRALNFAYKFIPYEWFSILAIKSVEFEKHVLENFEKYQPIFGVGFEKNIISKRLEYLVKFFEVLKTRVEIENELLSKDIPISTEKIKSFKENITEEWQHTKNVEILFEKYNSVIETNESINDHIGFHINVSDGRKIFLNDTQEFNTTWDLGLSFSNAIDLYFLDLVSDNNIITFNSEPLEIVAKSLESLRAKNFNPDVVIMHYRLLAINSNLEYFTMSNSDEYGIFTNIDKPEFEGITFFLIKQYSFKNKFIVADFQNSFEMIRLNKEPILNIDIDIYSAEEVNTILEKCKNIDNEIELIQSKKLLEKMNEVSIIIYQNIKINTKNSNSFEVFEYVNVQH